MGKRGNETFSSRIQDLALWLSIGIGFVLLLASDWLLVKWLLGQILEENSGRNTRNLPVYTTPPHAANLSTVMPVGIKNVQSVAAFVVADGQGNVVSEHAKPHHAMKALGSYLKKNDDKGATILRRKGKLWEEY